MFLGRFCSSIVLLIIFLCAFLLKGVIGLTIFTIIGFILSIVCVKEFSNMLSKIDMHVYKTVTITFSCMFFLGVIFEKVIDHDISIGIFVLALFAIFCWFKFLDHNRKRKLL